MSSLSSVRIFQVKLSGKASRAFGQFQVGKGTTQSFGAVA